MQILFCIHVVNNNKTTIKVQYHAKQTLLLFFSNNMSLSAHPSAEYWGIVPL